MRQPPRPSGTAASSGAAAQRGERVEMPEVKADERPPPPPTSTRPAPRRAEREPAASARDARATDRRDETGEHDGAHRAAGVPRGGLSAAQRGAARR